MKRKNKIKTKRYQSHLDSSRRSSGKVSKSARYWSLANKVLMILIMAVGVGYVISINDISIKGFILADLRSDILELEKSNEVISLKITALESYEHINSQAQAMAMVRVDKIDYISVSDAAVAQK